MKNLSDSDLNETSLSTKENITNLEEDLATVTESFMNELDVNTIFYNSFRILTKRLYDYAEDHRIALQVLLLGIDDGILEALEKRHVV